MRASSGALPADANPAAQRWRGLGARLARAEPPLIDEPRRRELHREWEDISTREAELDDRLLVALVGGTGVGKSTLINALAGEEISRSSDRRPTTDRVVVYRHREVDLPAEVPRGDLARPPVLHASEEIERLILLDFPDLDSAESAHAEILERYLPHLDVLLVVIDDEKYADRRLFEFLRALPQSPANLHAILNKTDRIRRRYGEREPDVIAEILEDFRGKLQSHLSLRIDPERCLAVSALEALRRALRGGGRTDPKEGSEESAVTSSGGSEEEGGLGPVLALLEGFRDEKRRRASKELNLEARRLALKGAVLAALRKGGAGPALGELERGLAERRREIEALLVWLPVALFGEAERPSLRRFRVLPRLRARGFPFSFLALLPARALRRRGGVAGEGVARLASRIALAYRPWAEAIEGVTASVRAEVAGTSLADDPAWGAEQAGPAGAGSWAEERAVELRAHLDSPPASAPAGGWRRHWPALLVVGFALWSALYPVLESALGPERSWGRFGGALLEALLRGLHPFFIVSTLAGVAIAYALAAVVGWAREQQRAEEELRDAEAAVRRSAERVGEDLLGTLQRRADELRRDLESLESLAGPQRAISASAAPGAAPASEAAGPRPA